MKPHLYQQKKLLKFGSVSWVVALTLLIVVFSMGTDTQAQQKPLYSQYMFNGLAINPAYAGNQRQFTATALYRKQWINIEGSPNVQTLAIHNGFKKKRVGLGLLLSRDEVGVHTDLSVYGCYAYKIRMRKGRQLSLGLQAGFNNITSMYGKLVAKTPNDPLLPAETSVLAPNFGTGIYYSTKTSYIGASIPLLLNNTIINRRDITIITNGRQGRNYFIAAGKVFDLRRKVKFKPSTLIRMQEGSPIGFDLNANLILNDYLTVGTSFRSGYAMVYLMEFQIADGLRLGYAYDWTMSALNPYSRGTHEVMLTYRYTKKQKCHTYF